MSEYTFELGRSDVRVMLWHLALYGLGAILEDASVDVRLSWTSGMRPRARVHADGVDADAIAEVVHRHAVSHTQEASWVMRDVTLSGSPRGLMSPRISKLGDAEWERLRSARADVLRALTEAGSWLDLRLLSTLGEPCYWSRDSQNKLRQDDGASRLEMQPRNNGAEFVRTRLRKLAETVAAREGTAVRHGLDGSTVRDELGGDGPRSVTATGFATPGPADNAVAWCALWGIALFPITPRINQVAVTTGHLGRATEGWFYAPVWTTAWPVARLRTILASRHLRDACAAGPAAQRTPDDMRAVSAKSWLQARAVRGLVRFPIERFGSANAPERRAMLGQPVSMIGNVGER